MTNETKEKRKLLYVIHEEEQDLPSKDDKDKANKIYKNVSEQASVMAKNKKIKKPNGKSILNENSFWTFLTFKFTFSAKIILNFLTHKYCDIFILFDRHYFN